MHEQASSCLCSNSSISCIFWLSGGLVSFTGFIIFKCELIFSGNFFSLGFPGCRDWRSPWQNLDIYLSPRESFTTCGLGWSTHLHAMCLSKWGELSRAPYTSGKPLRVPCFGLYQLPSCGCSSSSGIAIMILWVCAVLIARGPSGSFSLLVISDTRASLFLHFCFWSKQCFWSFWCYIVSRIMCSECWGGSDVSSAAILARSLWALPTLLELIWGSLMAEQLKQQSLQLLRSQDK